MNHEPDSYARRAAELRRAFDRSFQEPHAEAAAQTTAFLAIRVLADPYALRATEISGLFVDRPVTRLPGPLRELLGVVGFRGALLPVYCLATLLGYDAGASPRRWLATTGGARPVALAFHALDEHLRVASDAVSPRSRPSEERRPLSGVLESNGTLYSVVDLPALVKGIEARVLATTSDKGTRR